MPKVIPIQNGTEVLNNIFYMLKSKGIRQNELAEYLGISKNSITQWKTGRTSSYLNYIDQIATYLGVTSNELLHPKEVLKESLLSPEEIELIHNLRLIKNEDTRKSITVLLRALVNN